MERIMKNLAAFAIGLIFGTGLLVSGMNQPEKVLGFLDLFGRWDPSLLFVMAGAVAIGVLGFALADRRATSVFGGPVARRTSDEINGRLIAGATIFGVGWGLSGVCPGPAIVNLGFASGPAIIFGVAMIAGMAAYEIVERFVRLPEPSDIAA
jgi:uncharacterized membrane protein YedE/YeeE